MRKLLIFALVFGVAIVMLAISAAGQTFPELAVLQPGEGQQFVAGGSVVSLGPQQSDGPVPIPLPTPRTPQPGASIVGNGSAAASAASVLPGTHILAVLTSPLHSTSGTEGSGVYLEVLAPVVQGDRVVVPAHTYVQGTVEGNKRPGHFQRTSEFRFHFTTMIFPNNHVEPMDAVLQSIPGSKTTRARSGDGTLHTVDQTEKVLIPGAAGAVGGGVVGSVSRLGVGTYVGAGLGAGFGLGAVLLHRGDDIDLPAGTRVEMVLRSEIKLSETQQAFNAKYIAPPPTVFPAVPAETPDRSSRRRNDSALMWPLLGAMLLH